MLKKAAIITVALGVGYIALVYYWAWDGARREQ